jgi:thiamine-monophosphate kinase
VAKTLRELGEDALIEIFAAEAGQVGAKVLVPNGDDAAAFVVESKYAVVVTTDTLVERVHFDLDYCPPHKVGRKLMSVNLSDIAAMGARPRYVLLSVTMPDSTDVELARAIADGVREQARAHGVAILGGNTTRTAGPIVLTATLIGRAEPQELIKRRGTQCGDAIFVTGRLGDAAAGLRLALAGVRPYAGHPYFALWQAQVDPTPRVDAGRALAKAGVAHAMCDVSDGLGRDLARLLEPEGLGAHVEAHALPISEPLRSFTDENGLSAELIALEGGEDYELVFTAAPEDEKEIVRVLAESGTPVARIGTVTATRDIDVFLSDGTVIAPPSGFDHFHGGE